MASVQDAIKQAQEAAASMAKDEESSSNAVIEGHVGQGGQVITYNAPSLNTFNAQKGLLPRNTIYLKPTEFGIQVGKDKKNLVDDFEAELVLEDGKGFMLKWTVRFGNPAQYLSSYDGVNCNKGGTWSAAVQNAIRAGAKDDPYPAAEVKLKLLKDLKLKSETLPAGTIIGYDTSAPSRYGDFSDFVEEAQAAGKMGETVKVKVIGKDIAHNGNNWGTILFELA